MCGVTNFLTETYCIRLGAVYDEPTMNAATETTASPITSNTRLGSLERSILNDLNASAHGLIRVGASEKASALRLVEKMNGRVRLDVALYLSDTQRYVTKRPAYGE